MRAAALALGLGAASVASAAELYGLFRRSGSANPTICDLISVDPATGVNKTIAQTSVCAEVTQTWPSYSALDTSGSNLIVAVATAPYIYEVPLDGSAAQALAPLPSYDGSDAYLGLVHFDAFNTTYLVTQSSLYQVLPGQLTKVLAFTTTLPGAASVTGTASKGTAGTIWVADSGSSSVYTIDVAEKAVSTLTSGINGPLDAQYSSVLNALVELKSYQLFKTSVTSGSSSKICDVPDGPGYPRVNGMGPDGKTFWFIDFSNVYTIDVTTGTVSDGVPFSAAPRIVGFPQWVQ